MTAQEQWAFVLSNCEDDFFNLRERWECEKEYEDIADYLKAIQVKIPNAYAITKRPFGVRIKCSDGLIWARVKPCGDSVKMICSMCNEK